MLVLSEAVVVLVLEMGPRAGFGPAVRGDEPRSAQVAGVSGWNKNPCAWADKASRSEDGGAHGLRHSRCANPEHEHGDSVSRTQSQNGETRVRARCGRETAGRA